MKFTKKLIYISLFAILYLIVAFSSLYHAVEFFGLANNMWMAVILAFAFEVGQAAVLFALLTSNKDRGKIMPWVLMTMFTLVQVLGNVYSSYKHIINNSVENLKYFKEPIFIWTQLPDDQATVIITYLVGGLLPISALLLTSMVTNYLSDDQQSLTIKEEINNEINEDNKKIDTNIHENNINTEENKDNDQKDIEQIDNEDINISEEPISIEKIHELNENYDSGEISENNFEETEETEIKGFEDSEKQENKVISYENQNEEIDNKTEDNKIEDNKTEDNKIEDNKKENNKKESHFINLNK